MKKLTKLQKLVVAAEKVAELALSPYGGVGGAIVTSWKKDLEETKCCGRICLPDVLTRLYMARQINEAIDKAVRYANKKKRVR